VKRVYLTTILILALAVASPSQAGGPITKQNGSHPAFAAFTSICAVSGYAGYGLCGGDPTTFTNVSGKMNAIQFKPGMYNLDFTFASLTPGVEYRLLATRDAVPFGGSWFEVGRVFADVSGLAQYKLSTDAPAGLGFDLNLVQGDITVVTSWWSGEYLVVNPDGTLRAAV
jgi:hypothetical protein